MFRLPLKSPKSLQCYLRSPSAMVLRPGNHDLRELLGAIGYRGKQIPGFLSAVPRYRNTSQIQHFDEVVGYAQHHMRHLVGPSGGESVGAGDAENALWVRLKQGFEQIPARHDDAVVELARQIFETNQMTVDADDTIGRRILADPDDPFSDYVPFNAFNSADVVSARAESC